MSRMLRIQILAEGETDKIVIDAFIEAIVGDASFVSTLIQPETSRAFGHAGPYGGGWRGVRGKCLEMRERGGPDVGGYLENTDILIVHLDGEVADEPEIACAKPCPPPSDTAASLEDVVYAWMGEPGSLRVVMAIPMMETEAWIVSALRPNDKLLEATGEACFECRPKPSALLAGGSPRLIRSGKKHKSSYRAIETQLVAGFPHARALSQVQRFEERLRVALAAWMLGGNKV